MSLPQLTREHLLEVLEFDPTIWKWRTRTPHAADRERQGDIADFPYEGRHCVWVPDERGYVAVPAWKLQCILEEWIIPPPAKPGPRIKTVKPVRPDRCSVCSRDDRPICWDHDHATGKFRGWICSACNSALGFVKDSADTLRRLAAYLDHAAAEARL